MYGSVRRYRIDPKNMDELVKSTPAAEVGFGPLTDVGPPSQWYSPGVLINAQRPTRAANCAG
jgi:hypothetical protein